MKPILFDMNETSITQLVKELTLSIATIDKQEAVAFSNVYLEAVTSTPSLEDIEFGFSPNTQYNSLIHTMQHFGTNSSNQSIQNIIWNPIVATLVKHLKPNPPTVRGRDKTAALTSAMDRLDLPSRNKTRLNNNQKPKNFVSGVDLPNQQCDDNIEKTVRISINETSSAVFKNLRHIKCTKSDCQFCKQLATALPVTKCAQITCHKPGVVCHPSGWYVHALPITWLSVRKQHDKGLPFPGIRTKDMAKVETPPPPRDDPDKPSPSRNKRQRSMSSDSLTSLHSVMPHDDSSQSSRLFPVDWSDMDSNDSDVRRVDLTTKRLAIDQE